MASELRRWLAERLPDYLTRDHDRDVMAQFMDGGGANDRDVEGSGTDVRSAGDLTNDGSGDGASAAPSPASGSGGYDDGR